jgi:hypothetical protein
MEMHGNPGSALAEAIADLKALTVRLYHRFTRAEHERARCLLSRLRRMNDLLERAAVRLAGLGEDPRCRPLAEEIFAHLNLRGNVWDEDVAERPIRLNDDLAEATTDGDDLAGDEGAPQ